MLFKNYKIDDITYIENLKKEVKKNVNSYFSYKTNVIGKMTDDQEKRVTLSGLDPNNADPKLVEQENKKIYDTKSVAKQYKIDKMAEIDALTAKIKSLNQSLRTAPSEEQDSIRKQINENLGQIENKYYEITAKGAESGDDSLDDYFTKREDDGVVYTEDRQEFMNQIFKETKLSAEDFIKAEQAKYEGTIKKKGGKVGKTVYKKHGGQIGTPRGVGAALRGYGKGYK